MILRVLWFGLLSIPVLTVPIPAFCCPIVDWRVTGRHERISVAMLRFSKPKTFGNVVWSTGLARQYIFLRNSIRSTWARTRRYWSTLLGYFRIRFDQRYAWNSWCPCLPRLWCFWLPAWPVYSCRLYNMTQISLLDVRCWNWTYRVLPWGRAWIFHNEKE